MKSWSFKGSSKCFNSFTFKLSLALYHATELMAYFNELFDPIIGIQVEKLIVVCHVA